MAEFLLNGVLKDCKFALRQLWQRPGFTIIAVVVLALGLGANAAIFSVVNALLLKPLPYPHPDTLVSVFEKDVVGDSEDDHYNSVSPSIFHDWRQQAHSVPALSAFRRTAFNLASKSQAITPQRVKGIACSANFASILGVSPELGRFLSTSEDRQDAPRAAVLSYGFWQDHFAAARNILGQQIHLDDNSYTIVGVLPKSFIFPGEPADVFVSFERSLEPYNRSTYSNHFFDLIGRLAPGYSVAAAQQEMSAILQRARRTHPREVMGRASTVIQFDRYLVRDFKTALLILLGAVGCLLLIACVNIANLLLGRSLGRQRELAIRSAVGAGRTQLVRQLLIESTTVALLGAIAGLIVAGWTTSFLATHAPGVERLPQTANIRIDQAVLFFTTVIAILTGIAAGFFPALAASRIDLLNGLKDTSRSTTPSRAHGRLRNTLVAIEVAVSLVLLVGAGLLLRSFFHVANTRSGFRTENSISFAVSLPEATYKNREAIGNFVRLFAENLRAVPGVTTMGLIDYAPLSGSQDDSVFHIEGHPLPPGSMMDLVNRAVDPDYFHAMGIPLLKGRFLNARDGEGYDDMHPRIGQVLISQSAAHEFFANIDPIGQRLQYGTDVGLPPDPSGHPHSTYQIVGVVGDVPVSIEDGIKPTIYRPIFDGGDSDFYAVVHSSTNPVPLLSRIREQVHKLDPDIPVHDVRTFEQINSTMTGNRRFSVSLLSLFAGVAMLLAAVGLYGVVSHAVTQRTSEIGIRMALGASRAEVSRLILLGGMRPALIGIGAGLIASFACSRILQSMLVGISSVDAVTFVAVPVLLALVVALACLVPAFRATRIDPTVALRSE
ncbi:MAG TPA: ABC transporter permease [Bryobacteraceae bacterium]|nr:ABC transporter permease [Bryobacteraceae bacterium]